MPLRSRVDEPGPAHLAGWSERVRPPLQRRRERRGSRYEGLRLRAVDRLAQGVLGAEDGHHACQPDRSKTGAAARGLGAFVRIPDHGPTWVQRCLDAGAHGVMAPHVDSVEQARALQVAARFPPHGSRGCGPTTRAGGWGLVPQSDYLTAESSVLGQVDSDSGVEAADRMAKGRLVDSLFVGPADLGLSLGVEPGSDELRARIDRVRAVGAAREDAHGTKGQVVPLVTEVKDG